MCTKPPVVFPSLQFWHEPKLGLIVREILEQGRTDRTTGQERRLSCLPLQKHQTHQTGQSLPKWSDLPYRPWLILAPSRGNGEREALSPGSFSTLLDTYSSSFHPFLWMSVPDASRSQDCMSHIYRDRSSAQSGMWLSSHVVAEQAWGHHSVLCLVSPTHAPSKVSSQMGYGYLPLQKQTCPWGSHTWCTSACCTWTSPFVHQKTASYELAQIYHSWLILRNGGFSCTWHLPMDDKRRGFSSLQLPNLKRSSPLWLHSLYFEATVGPLYHEDWVLMQSKTELITERLVEKDQSLFKHSQCGWHCGEPSLHTIV